MTFIAIIMFILSFCLNKKKKKKKKKTGKMAVYIYGTSKGTFPFRYLSEKKLRQGY